MYKSHLHFLEANTLVTLVVVTGINSASSELRPFNILFFQDTKTKLF